LLNVGTRWWTLIVLDRGWETFENAIVLAHSTWWTRQTLGTPHALYECMLWICSEYALNANRGWGSGTGFTGTTGAFGNKTSEQVSWKRLGQVTGLVLRVGHLTGHVLGLGHSTGLVRGHKIQQRGHSTGLVRGLDYLMICDD